MYLYRNRLILMILINREFEASYRLSFYISLLSARDRRKMLSMKNQGRAIFKRAFFKLLLGQI